MGVGLVVKREGIAGDGGHQQGRVGVGLNRLGDGCVVIIAVGENGGEVDRRVGRVFSHGDIGDGISNRRDCVLRGRLGDGYRCVVEKEPAVAPPVSGVGRHQDQTAFHGLGWRGLGAGYFCPGIYDDRVRVQCSHDEGRTNSGVRRVIPLQLQLGSPPVPGPIDHRIH